MAWKDDDEQTKLQISRLHHGTKMSDWQGRTRQRRQGVPILCTVLLVTVWSRFVGTAAATATTLEESPEARFRRTLATWQSGHSWTPWKDFALELGTLFAQTAPSITQEDSRHRLEMVGALEEGILVVERTVFQGSGSAHDDARDAVLAVLYTTYGETLMDLSARECLDLALDPHTLLIGAETVAADSSPDTYLCQQGAENALRNAATLDATYTQATVLLQSLLNETQEDVVHKRKPKEFVAELFDSFAETFDEKLLQNLDYKVPQLVGDLAQSLLRKSNSHHNSYQAILDAGCGTGLAGRSLLPTRQRQHQDDGLLVGVDASQKMLTKAEACTYMSGCGLPILDEKDDSPALYDALLQMDLEEMTLQNTLQQVPRWRAMDQHAPAAFDLIVAADVLVYFGSLKNLLTTFGRLTTPGGYLIFSCELATLEQAPLGWRLLPSGRFSHTQQHAVDAANEAGYQLVSYDEITPRTEKGEAVHGHLFGFQLSLLDEAQDQQEL